MAYQNPASIPDLEPARPEKPTVASFRSAQRMTWTQRIVAGVFVLAVVGITVASLMPKPQPPVNVQMVTARKGSITRVVTAGGKLQAATEVKLSPTSPATFCRSRSRRATG